MSSDPAKTVTAETVYKIVRTHTRGGLIAVLALEGVLIWGAARAGGALQNGQIVPLMYAAMALAAFYLVVLAGRFFRLLKSRKVRPRHANQRELYKALTPERFMVAGSLLTAVFCIAVMLGLPILSEAVTILVGIGFVTPLGFLLNEWGALDEHFKQVDPPEDWAAWQGCG